MQFYRDVRILYFVKFAIFILLGYFLFTNIKIPACHDVHQVVNQWGVFSPIAFVMAHALAVAVFVPGIVINMMAGFVFGALGGTVLAVLGATFGATIAFIFSRFFIRDLAQSYLKSLSWYDRFTHNVRKNGLKYILFLRVVPLFPYNGINVASGVSPLSVRQFIFGSLIGMIPGTFVYVYLGTAGCEIIDGVTSRNIQLWSISDDLKIRLFIVFTFLAVLSFMPFYVKRIPILKNFTE